MKNARPFATQALLPFSRKGDVAIVMISDHALDEPCVAADEERFPQAINLDE